jgi:hypothetical protein
MYPTQLFRLGRSLCVQLKVRDGMHTIGQQFGYTGTATGHHAAADIPRSTHQQQAIGTLCYCLIFHGDRSREREILNRFALLLKDTLCAKKGSVELTRNLNFRSLARLSQYCDGETKNQCP